MRCGMIIEQIISGGIFLNGALRSGLWCAASVILHLSPFLGSIKKFSMSLSPSEILSFFKLFLLSHLSLSPSNIWTSSALPLPLSKRALLPSSLDASFPTSKVSLFSEVRMLSYWGTGVGDKKFGIRMTPEAEAPPAHLKEARTLWYFKEGETDNPAKSLVISTFSICFLKAASYFIWILQVCFLILIPLCPLLVTTKKSIRGEMWWIQLISPWEMV